MGRPRSRFTTRSPPPRYGLATHSEKTATLARPHVGRAVAEEKRLYVEELARDGTPLDPVTAKALQQVS